MTSAKEYLDKAGIYHDDGAILTVFETEGIQTTQRFSVADHMDWYANLRIKEELEELTALGKPRERSKDCQREAKERMTEQRPTTIEQAMKIVKEKGINAARVLLGYPPIDTPDIEENKRLVEETIAILQGLPKGGIVYGPTLMHAGPKQIGGLAVTMKASTLIEWPNRGRKAVESAPKETLKVGDRVVIGGAPIAQSARVYEIAYVLPADNYLLLWKAKEEFSALVAKREQFTKIG